MSSSLRSTANTPRLPMVHFVNGPCMYLEQVDVEPPGLGGSPGFNVAACSLIPFVYSNQVLDINFDVTVPGPGYTFPDTMMTYSLGDSTPHFPGYFNYPASSQIRLLGGTHLVTKIGDNFKSYVEVIYTQYFGSATNIKVVRPGIVTKVQILNVRSLGTWLGIIDTEAPELYYNGDSPSAPNSDYQLDVYPKFAVTYIFSEPLTISVDTNSGTRYFTLKSQLS